MNYITVFINIIKYAIKLTTIFDTFIFSLDINELETANEHGATTPTVESEML